MPSAMLRPCAEPGCAELVAATRCAQHARAQDGRRGSPQARGYDNAWKRLVQLFKARLVHREIAPVCGARLPGAPVTADSRCAADGRLNATRLHVDHIVPHKGDRQRFRDLLNLQLLCVSCHSAKTAREGAMR
jgi:5-methylcytosine-specific restriction protein A